jgi:CHASE2 domain-containing sensor protein
MKRGLSAVALVVIVVAAFELLGLELLKPLENRLLDRFVKAQAGRVAPDPDIVLVDIDEKSLASERLSVLGDRMQPMLDSYSNQLQLLERFNAEARAAR